MYIQTITPQIIHHPKFPTLNHVLYQVPRKLLFISLALKDARYLFSNIFFFRWTFFSKMCCPSITSPATLPRHPKELVLSKSLFGLGHVFEAQAIGWPWVEPLEKTWLFRRALGPWGSIDRDHEFTGSWSHQLLNEINLGKLLGVRQPDCFYYRTCLGLIFS